MPDQTKLETKTTLSTNTIAKFISGEDGELLSLSVQDGTWVRFINIALGEGDREKIIELLQNKKEK